MSFVDQLADHSAPQIIAALGCPRSTAYEWKDGRRSPPPWLQPHLLRIIQAFPVAVRTPKASKGIKVELVAAERTRKKHNKASLATDASREVGSRKRKS